MTQELTDLKRVVIIGSSCTGKTTLARTLAATLDLKHFELDALYWHPHWTPCPTEEFCTLVRAAVAGDIGTGTTPPDL